MNCSVFLFILIFGEIICVLSALLPFVDYVSILVKISKTHMPKGYDKHKKLMQSIEYQTHKKKWIKTYLLLSIVFIISYLVLYFLFNNVSLSLYSALILYAITYGIANNLEARQRKTLENKNKDKYFSLAIQTGEDSKDLLEAIEFYQSQHESTQSNQSKQDNHTNCLELLKNEISKNSNLDEIIDIFKKMCEIPIENSDILFETGTYSFTGTDMFYFSLVRQFDSEDNDEYTQIHVNALYEPNSESKELTDTVWDFQANEPIFDLIKNSASYNYVKNKKIADIQIYIDET